MSWRDRLRVILASLPLAIYLNFSVAVIYSNISVPSVMPFTLRTTLPIIFACLFSLIALLISLPRTSEYMKNRMTLSKGNYAVMILLPILISAVLAAISVMYGSMDYTAYQAQVN